MSDIKIEQYNFNQDTEKFDVIFSRNGKQYSIQVPEELVLEEEDKGLSDQEFREVLAKAVHQLLSPPEKVSEDSPYVSVYMNREHGWKLLEYDTGRDPIDENRMLFVVDIKNNEIVHDPRLDDNVWQFDWELIKEREAEPLIPIGEAVQGVLNTRAAELKSLGIYAAFQPVNLGNEKGSIDLKLDTLYYHTGMFTDKLLDKLEMEFPNEALKEEFKECVLFDIHSDTCNSKGALVTPYEAYIAQNYTNDMEELIRLSQTAQERLSDLAWEACNEALDTIDYLEDRYKEERHQPKYEINLVVEVFIKEEPLYFETEHEAKEFVKMELQSCIREAGEYPATFVDQDGLTFRECIDQMSFNLGSETLSTVELPPGFKPKKDEPERDNRPASEIIVSQETTNSLVICAPGIAEAALMDVSPDGLALPWDGPVTVPNAADLPFEFDPQNKTITIQEGQVNNCAAASETLRNFMRNSDDLQTQRFVLKDYTINDYSPVMENPAVKKGIQKILSSNNPKKIAKTVSGLLSGKANQLKKTIHELEKAGKEAAR